MYTIENYTGGELFQNSHLINEASPEEFISTLTKYSANHRAVNHPYLTAIENGELPDIMEALKEYAYQYSFYSRDFTNYLAGVIGCLSSEEHKELLLENLCEENGDIHDFDCLSEEIAKKISDVPHSELFNWFQKAIGVDEKYRGEHKPLDVVLEYREKFTKLCYTNQAVGVGAIGISTESIVPKVYSHFLASIKNFTNLNEEERVFFDLHGVADVKHSEQILKIAQDLSDSEQNRKFMVLGVEEALNLREKFWDELLERAMAMKGTK
jgi:pyrroloquinoline quinone (PQQ) biosynthesis protein C